MIRPAAFMASSPSTTPLCLVGSIRVPALAGAPPRSANSTTPLSWSKFQRVGPRRFVAPVSKLTPYRRASMRTLRLRRRPAFLPWLSSVWPRSVRSGPGPLHESFPTRSPGPQLSRADQALHEFTQHRRPFFGIDTAREMPLVALELEIGRVDARRLQAFHHARADRRREQLIGRGEHVEHLGLDPGEVPLRVEFSRNPAQGDERVAVEDIGPALGQRANRRLLRDRIGIKPGQLLRNAVALERSDAEIDHRRPDAALVVIEAAVPIGMSGELRDEIANGGRPADPPPR